MRLKKIIILNLLTLALAAIGIIGYMSLEGWSFMEALYMTVITLTTTGYREVSPLSWNGRLFTIVFLITGFSFFAFLISTIIKEIISFEFNQFLRRNRMKKKISQFSEHTILCGFGRMGQAIAEQLEKANKEFVIIEEKPSIEEELIARKYPYLIDNASNDECLLAAGIKKANHLITVISSDSENVFISLSARSLNANIQIIARANEESTEHKLKKAGADKVISPYTITSSKITQSIVNPTIEDFLDIVSNEQASNFKLADVIIQKGSPYKNKSLAETNFRELGIIIVGIRKSDGSMIFAPQSTDALNEGDRVFALGNSSGVTRLMTDH